MHWRDLKPFGLGLTAGLLSIWGANTLDDWRYDVERWMRRMKNNPNPKLQGHSEVHSTVQNWRCNCHGPHFVSVYLEDQEHGSLSLEDYHDVRMNDWTDLTGLKRRIVLAIQVLFGNRCSQISIGLDPDTARDIARALEYGAEKQEAYYARERFDWRTGRLTPLTVPQASQTLDPGIRG